MQLLMTGLAVLILTAIVALSGFFIVADERRGTSSGTGSAVPPPATRDISSRRVDAVPLSLTEVFPNPEIQLVADATPYRVTTTHLDADCATVATGLIGARLRDEGCTQVVRAALIAPYGGYQVTAGIVNLVDSNAATLLGDQIGPLVEAGDGTFAVLTATPPAADGPVPLAQIGWHDVGHYLIYCAITRPDGQLISDDDPNATRITADLVESYLGGTVLGRRQSHP
ncbi:MAG: hypothetical protein QOC94_2919 [Actinoplanes sp.]|jgi:hypothetical protein|nr:hypothetical protein [Actinoplanes sp.]